MKKLICIIICFVMIFFTIPLCVGVSAGTNMVCSELDCSNVGANEYVWNWSSVVNSYVSNSSNGGLMLVQYDGEKLYAEYYDAQYNITSVKQIPNELPIFGAFYETEDYYFVLSGQNNPNESADVEVCRLTKYDKNWNRLSSVGFYDINTVIPFDAGSARMAHSGDYLVIRTCHEMYKSDDGLNHQANMSFCVNFKTMEIIGTVTRVANINWGGYVSHSFNQFVKIENDRIVAVDHGDAYPRSIVLVKYRNVLSDSKDGSLFSVDRASDVFRIYGSTGDNYTGATVGGFEFSSSSYLVAGNSVIRDENYYNRKTKNIFVSAVDKGANEVKLNWITNFEEGDGTTSTPHLVKINNSRFLLLWTRESNVYYCELDANGKKVGNIHSFKGDLSDCAPIIRNSKVFWYVCDNGIVDFYEIDTKNIKNATKKQVNNAHDYEITKSEGGTKANFNCKKCGDHYEIEEVKVLWRTADETEYTTEFKGTYPVGTVLYYKFQEANSDKRYTGGMSRSWSSSSVFKWRYDYNEEECDGGIEIIGHGDGYITFSSNEYVSRTFNLNIPHKYVKTDEQKATCTDSGYIKYTCNCGSYKYEYPQKIAHKFSWVKKNTTYFADGANNYKCLDCGKINTTQIIPKLKLSVPSFKLTKGKKQFKVKYTSVKDATGFQVRYRIKGKWKIKNFNSIKTVTKTIKKLKKGTYKVQVRSFVQQGDNKAYSSWAKAKTVKVK